MPRMPEASVIFSEELSLLSPREQQIFRVVLEFFPNPAPFTVILRKIEELEQAPRGTYTKNIVEVNKSRINNRLKKSGKNIFLKIARDYGYSLVHPDILPSWWSILSRKERLALMFILEHPDSTYDDIYTFLSTNKELSEISSFDSVHSILKRLRTKIFNLSSQTFKENGGKSNPKISLQESSSFYTKELMLEDLKAAHKAEQT